MLITLFNLIIIIIIIITLYDYYDINYQLNTSPVQQEPQPRERRLQAFSYKRCFRVVMLYLIEERERDTPYNDGVGPSNLPE